MRLQKILLGFLLILLPTQLGIHSWPSWALVLGRRVDYLSPTFYLTDLLILGLFGFFLQKSQREQRDKKDQKIRKHWWLVLVFLLLGGVNIYFSLSPILAIYKWLKLIEFIGLGLVVVGLRPGLVWVIKGLIYAAAWSAGLAVWQWWKQGSVGGAWWWLGERTFNVDTPAVARATICAWGDGGCWLVLRAYATFSHPNVLGAFLGLVLPLVLFLIVSDYKKFTNWWRGLAVSLGLGLVLTFGRAAILVAAGITTLTILVSRQKRSGIWLLLSVIFLGTLVGIIAARSQTDESLVVRWQLLQAAWVMWKTAPWFGVGLGNFLIALPHHLVNRSIYFLQPVHNIYFLWIVETGLIGLGFMVFGSWFYVRLVYRSFRKLVLARQKLFFTIWLFLMFGVLILGSIDHYFLSLQQGQLFLTILLTLPFLL